MPHVSLVNYSRLVNYIDWPFWIEIYERGKSEIRKFENTSKFESNLMFQDLQISALRNLEI